MECIITDTRMVSYSQKYKNFIDTNQQCVLFKIKHSSVITNMDALYVQLFHIMDIAKGMNLPCVLKDILTLLPEFTAFTIMLKKNIPEDDFDGLIDELQNDVNLILDKGFVAFESKLLNLFAEIEQDEIDFKKLIDNIDKCTSEIKNLNTDTILANQSN